MAETIALNIVLNGVPQAVSGIEQLELQLKQAKLELSEMQVGTAGFTKLSAEIKTVEGDLKALQTSAGNTGRDLGTKLGDLARLGGAIGASFAAASSAFSLFGKESEATTKALAEAQNLLVIALGARQAAEGLAVIKTVALDFATKAQSLSTKAANATTKAFYLTLAANPYTAIITGIGLVVGALIMFSGKSKEATKRQQERVASLKAQNEEEKKAAEFIGKESSAFVGLIGQLKVSNAGSKTRKDLIKEINSTYNTTLKNLSDETEFQKQLNLEVVNYIAYQKARYKLQQFDKAIQENLEKQSKLERELVDAQKEYNREFNITLRQDDLYAGTREANLREYQAQIDGIKTKISDADLRLTSYYKTTLDTNAIIEEITGGTEKYTKSTKENTENIDKNTDAKDDNIEATETQIKLAKDLENALNDEIDSLQKAVDAFNKIAESEKIDIGEPEVLTTIKDLKSAIDGFIPDTIQDKFREIGLEVEFIDGEFKVLKNTLESTTDVYGEFVEGLRKTLSTGALNQSIQDFAITANNALDDVSLKFQKGIITKEALEATQTLIQQYKDFNKVVKELPKGVQDIFTPTALEEYLGIVKNIAIATGDIQFERSVNGEIVKITESTIKLSDELNNLEKFTKETTDALVKQYKDVFGTNFSEKQFKATIDNLVKTKALSEEQGKDLKEKYGEFASEGKNLIEELSKAQSDALNKTVQNIVAEEAQIRTFLFQVQDERTKALEVQGGVQSRVFLNNLDLFYEYTQEQNKIVVDDDKTSAQKRIDIVQAFADKKIDITNLSEAEIDKIIAFYLEKQNNALTEEQEVFQTRISNIQANIEVFQAALNSLSQTTSLYFDAQFDQLEKRNQRIQASIVGDSAAANQKRLEAEKSFQIQKAALEKKAAKTALRISLAQALANTAEAITKLAAITGGIGAVIGGAAIVAFNAIQVGIIGSQLANIDSYRRGGKISSGKFAGGGLVSGPSHEYGGVKFAGGGIELEGNEAVINRTSTINYMGLLDQINQAGGGKPITPALDDSRIVEAIAKQRNTPIRAYVVESDITAKQETARQLERLSQY